MRYLPLAMVLVVAFVPSEDFFTAVKKGDANAVAALLAKGGDVNAKSDYGATALHFAADKGHAEVVKVLLKYKADINAKDTYYNTRPLDWAIMRDRLEAIKLLVEAGSGGVEQAFSSAVLTGKAQVVQAMLSTGKIPQATLDSSLTAVLTSNTAIAELLRQAGAKAAPPSDTVKFRPYAGSYQAEAGSTPR